MRIHIKFFSTYREITGQAEIEVEIPSGATLVDLIPSLCSQYPRLTPHTKNMLLALNREYVHQTAPLKESDEVAVMPPVSGG